MGGIILSSVVILLDRGVVGYITMGLIFQDEFFFCEIVSALLPGIGFSKFKDIHFSHKSKFNILWLGSG